MKPKFLLLTMMLFAVCTACDERDLYHGQTPEKKVSDMNVPADFDWRTTRNFDCRLKTMDTRQVRIYNEESCKDESLLAIYTVSNTENPLRLHLPIHLETVYVKDGEKVYPMDVEGWDSYFTLPETKAGKATRADDHSEDDVIYFPCKGCEATIMFEDHFPITGDYDFNDLVGSYKYVIYLQPGTMEMLSIEFDMAIRAMGGIYPYDPCLRLEGIDTDYVNAIAITGSEDVVLGQFSDFDKDICYRMLNLDTKPDGCQFLNTDPKDRMIPESDLRKIHLNIRFQREGQFIPKVGDLLAFDIFLEKDNLEIHERGFTPCRTKYPDFNDCGDENYCNKKNMIWAFTIPTKMKHAKERVDFLKAYPLFDDWVESGGFSAKYWYTAGVDEHLVTIPEN